MGEWENKIIRKIKAVITTGIHKILHRAVLNCLISLINTTPPQILRQSDLFVGVLTPIQGSGESPRIVIYSNCFTMPHIDVSYGLCRVVKSIKKT